jgi:hypothetical protein
MSTDHIEDHPDGERRPQLLALPSGEISAGGHDSPPAPPVYADVTAPGERKPVIPAHWRTWAAPREHVRLAAARHAHAAAYHGVRPPAYLVLTACGRWWAWCSPWPRRALCDVLQRGAWRPAWSICCTSKPCPSRRLTNRGVASRTVHWHARKICDGQRVRRSWGHCAGGGINLAAGDNRTGRCAPLTFVEHVMRQGGRR